MLRPMFLFIWGKRCESSNIYSVVNGNGQDSKDGFLGDFIGSGYFPNWAKAMFFLNCSILFGTKNTIIIKQIANNSYVFVNFSLLCSGAHISLQPQQEQKCILFLIRDGSLTLRESSFWICLFSSHGSSDADDISIETAQTVRESAPW